MALKPFNTVGGLSVGPNVANVLVSTNAGDSNVANYTLSTAGYGNVTLGAVANIHVAGGNANAAVLGAVALDGNGNVTGITITSGGDGYTQAPDVVINGANTQTAHVTALIDGNGTVTGFTIDDAGTGYSSATAAISSPTPRYLQTNGNGNLSWKEVPASTVAVAGDNTEIQYNDDGNLGASNAFTFNDTTNTLTTTNLVVSNGAATITSNNGTTIRGVTIQGSTDAAFSANYTITLPTTDGSNLQFLQTDGNGITTWADTNRLVNGNSNVVVAANGNVTVGANGVSVVTINGTGDANTQGITVDGLVNTLGVVNGNSSVIITANANVVTRANGNAVVTVTSSGDGNRQTTGANIDGYITANGNITATNFLGALANGTSNVAIPAANGNVIVSANGQANVVVVSSNGTHATTTITNDLEISGNIVVNGNTTYINVETFTVEDPIIQLGTGANGAVPAQNTNDLGTLLRSNTAGEGAVDRFMGWDTSNSEFSFGSNITDSTNVITFNTLANVRAGNFIGTLANGTSNVRIAANANIAVSANGNANIFTITSSGDGNLLTTGAETTGYFTAGNNITALANVQSNNNVILEGTVQFADDYTNTATYFSNIGAATLATGNTDPNQSIVKVPYALGRVVEYLVKSADTVGDIYQAQSITAIISAANTIDYTNWGIVGNSAGTITVALTDSNANITLQVTPASTNSTVFTTQYRVL